MAPGGVRTAPDDPSGRFRTAFSRTDGRHWIRRVGRRKCRFYCATVIGEVYCVRSPGIEGLVGSTQRSIADDRSTVARLIGVVCPRNDVNIGFPVRRGL